MYKAFLSYAREDKRVAKALQTALERFAKPVLRQRALEVFRDDHVLRADDDLWGTILEALADSQFLILLASPDAAASAGVQRELEKWLSLHDGLAVNLLIVLTGGELAWSGGGIDWRRTTALPRILDGRFAAEPKWCDLRTLPVERMTLDDAEFRDELAALAARLHDVPKDELIGEDARAHRRFRQLVVGAAMLIASLAVGGGVASSTALRRMRIDDARNALREGVRAIEESREVSLASGEWNALTRDGVASVIRGARVLRQAGDPYPLESNEALRRAAQILPRAQREVYAGARTAFLRYAAKGDALLIVSPENVARVLRAGALGPPMPFEIDEPLVSDDLSVIGGVTRDGRLLLMRTDTGTPFPAVAERVERAFLSPSGARVVTSTNERSVLRRVDNGALVDLLRTGPLEAVAFSRDGKRMALVPRSAPIVVRGLPGIGSRELDTVLDGGYAASFDATGRFLAVASGCGAYVWDLSDEFSDESAVASPLCRGIGNYMAGAIRMSDDGARVTLRHHRERKAAVFDSRTGEPIAWFDEPSADLRWTWSYKAGVVEVTDIDRNQIVARVKSDLAPVSVAFSAGREVAIAVPARQTIRIFETHPIDEVSVASLPEPPRDAWLLHDPRPYWPTGTGDEIAQTLALPKEWSPPFTLSPRGRYLVAKGGDEPRVWDVRRNRRIAQLLPSGAGREWYAWAFSPDDRYFIVWTGIHGNLTGPTAAAVWNLEERRRIALLRVDAVPEAFAIDAKRLRFALAGRFDGVHRIRLVDLETGVVQEFAPRAPVTALAFDESGAMASAGLDRVIRVWDVAAEREIARIHTEANVEHLRFTRDGILVGGDRAWRWSNEALLAALER